MKGQFDFMDFKRRITAIMAFLIAFHHVPAFSQHSGLRGLSQEFLGDYNLAQKQVDQVKSAEPLIVLLGRYTNEVEQAELEVSIGLAFNQRTGVVDNAKAVVHFDAALGHELPEKTCIEILMWRGNSQEKLKSEEALKDYLRGLTACSYHDLSGGWPEMQNPKVPIFMNSPDPENYLRARDYHQYRTCIEFQRFLLRQRYYFIGAVKRVRPGLTDSDDETIKKLLEPLSPDSSRYGIIISWLRSENKKPWP